MTFLPSDDLTRHTTYTTHAHIVAAAVLSIQPRNGSDYSDRASQINRELIAVNVHLGVSPLLQQKEQS